MPQSHGYRHKTRRILRKSAGERKTGLMPLLRRYSVNDKVVIDIDPSQVKGMPHRRYQGRVGVVEWVGRRALKVTIPVGGKVKRVITRFEHVKPHVEVKADAGAKE